MPLVDVLGFFEVGVGDTCNTNIVVTHDEVRDEKLTSEEVDHVIDGDGRGEEDRDGERRGDLPGGGSEPEDLDRGEGGVEQLVRVSWRNSSSHQDILRGEEGQSAGCQLSYRLSSLLVGGAGGGHSGLIGVGQVLHKPIQVVPHHRGVDVGISEALRPRPRPSDHDDAVRVVVRHGA